MRHTQARFFSIIVVTTLIFANYFFSVRTLSLSFNTSLPLFRQQDSWLDEEYDVCCVGAGLSGSVIAERYSALLGKKVLVMEKRNHIGGNCYDYEDPDTNILVNKYGAHLFHTNYERVWEYVQKFSEWTNYEHQVLAYVDEQHVPVPVNIDTVNRLFGLSIETPAEMRFWLEKETASEKGNWKHRTPENSEEMAISRVGKRLYDLIFHPYTIKQWAKEPAELGPSVTARIPVRDNYDDRYFGDKYQALPSRGYTRLFERILENPLITVKTAVNYFDVRQRLKCGRTYFTGPIDAYFADLGMEKLEYRSLDFEKGIKWNTSFFQPLSVVNHPSPNVNFTRIVEYKHYLNQTSPHTIFFHERSKDGGEPYYPVPNVKNRLLFEKYQKLASREPNVTFVGRLANYKYFNMDQSIMNALELFDKDTGYQYVSETQPAELPGRDWSKPLATSEFPKPRRRVFLEAGFSRVDTGGPEALIQLALALKSFLPDDLFYWYYDSDAFRGYAPWFTDNYDVQQLAPVLKKLNDSEIQPGDILIIPEVQECREDLIRRGVFVYRWLLATNKPSEGSKSLRMGCGLLSHNFWLSNHPYHASGEPWHNAPPLPLESIIRPYVTPSLVISESQIALDKKTDLILLDDDNPQPVKDAVSRACEELNCTATIVHGFRRDQLPDLFNRARVVVDWCMVGSERMPLESGIRGAILMTGQCLCGQDFRDYPIPRRHVMSNPEQLREAIGHVLTNYTEVFKEYEEFRETYRGLNHTTMSWEAKSFYFSHDKNENQKFGCQYCRSSSVM